MKESLRVEDDMQFEQIAHREEQRILENEHWGSTKKNAAEYIMACITEVSQLGANDQEVSSLNELLENLDKDVISPEKARDLAQEIVDRKNSYH